MTDILVPERESNQRAAQYGLDILPATFGEGFGAAFDEALTRNATPSLLREIDRRLETRDATIDGTLIAPDTANERYGIPGRLSFDQPVADSVAQQLHTLKTQEIERQDTIRRAQSGVGTQLTAGLMASILDPLNVAAAFIPVFGEVRFATLAARQGMGVARVTKGAAEGLVGTALVEPIVHGVAQQEQADYSATDSVLNLVFGTVMGAGLHLGVGYLGDRLSGRAAAAPLPRAIDTLPKEDQVALLRSAVSQVVEDRPVDVSPVMEVVRPQWESLPIPAIEREATARQIDPGAFVVLDDVRAEISTLQLQMDTLRQSGVAKPEIVAAAQRLDDLEKKASNPDLNWRDVRDISTETEVLLDQFSRKEMTNALAHYAKQSEAHAVEVAQAEKRIGLLQKRIGAANERIAVAYKQAGDRLAGSPEYRQKVMRKAQVASQQAPELDVARASAAAETRTQEVAGPPKPIEDEIKWVEESITEAEQFMPADTKPDAHIQEMIKEANTYKKAWYAAASCRMRKS